MTEDATRLKSELARLAEQGDDPTSIMRWFKSEMGERYSDFSLVKYFFDVFDVPLMNLRRACGWIGLSPEGFMSDEEVNRLLQPLRVREY